MRHLRMVGVCLAAVFAITAIAATSASALPEWGKCVVQPKKEGKYTDSNCTKKAKKVAEKFTGEYEWIKGKELAPVKFSGGNVGSGGVLTAHVRICAESPGQEKPNTRTTRKGCEEAGGKEEYSEVLTIECESESNTGEATGTNGVANIAVNFKGCLAYGVIPCSNGPIEGEINVNTLKGKLGYINKAEKKVGVLLEPAKKHGDFATFNCAGFITVVGVGNAKEGSNYLPENTGGYDGIISPITPVNTMTTKYTQVYTVNPETQENIPSKFEGKHIELLEDYIYLAESPEYSNMWSPAGEEITNVNTAAEAGEIKA